VSVFIGYILSQQLGSTMTRAFYFTFFLSHIIALC